MHQMSIWQPILPRSDKQTPDMHSRDKEPELPGRRHAQRIVVPVACESCRRAKIKVSNLTAAGLVKSMSGTVTLFQGDMA